MDTTAIVPAAGLGLVIVTLVGYLLRQLVADRTDYRQAIADEQQRTKAAEARAGAERRRAAAAQQRADVEMEKRREAEAARAEADARLAAVRRRRWPPEEAL